MAPAAPLVLSAATNGEEAGLSVSCSHLDQIKIVKIAPPAEIAGCEECLASGGSWVHLRSCLTCGHIGCCDSSPGRHAAAHAGTEQHPIVRSAERGEEWCYCYVDEVAFEIAGT